MGVTFKLRSRDASFFAARLMTALSVAFFFVRTAAVEAAGKRNSPLGEFGRRTLDWILSSPGPGCDRDADNGAEPLSFSDVRTSGITS